MKWISLTYHAALAASMATLLSASLSACQEVIPIDEPSPLLVTLPAGGYAPTVTPTSAEAPTPTGEPTVTLVPQPNIATPTLVVQSVEATRLLWTLEGIVRPVALAPAGNRLAVLMADGRFLWVNTETGQVESTNLVWSSGLEGKTTGDVYSDGQVALIVASQETPDENGTIAQIRTRLVVYNSNGNELWSRDGSNSPPLSAALVAGTVILGQGAVDGQSGRLLAYDLQSGAEVWVATLPTPTPAPSPDPTLRPTIAPTATPLPSIEGYRAVRVADDQLYALIDTPVGSGAGAFDPFTGVERWRWLDGDKSPFEQISVSDDGLVTLAATDRLAALDPATGHQQWQVSFSVAPEAGLSVQNGIIQLAPAPTAEFEYRPGIMGLSITDGTPVWQALSGLLAGPLAEGDGYLWTLVKDYDQGQVSLSAIEPTSGTEAVRLSAGEHPEQPYRLVVQGRRVYVLGADLKVFGY
jgi:outer membrane protein assembly factor BamB